MVSRKIDEGVCARCQFLIEDVSSEFYVFIFTPYVAVVL